MDRYRSEPRTWRSREHRFTALGTIAGGTERRSNEGSMPAQRGLRGGEDRVNETNYVNRISDRIDGASRESQSTTV